MSFEPFICLRYIKGKKKHGFISLITFISVAGVAVGVMALIVVLAVMTGFTSELRDKILGVNSHIVVQKAGGVIYDYKGLMEKIQTEEGVVSVTPYIYSQTMLTAGSGGTGVVLRGIDPKSASSVLSLSKQITRGDFSGISSASEQERKIPGIIV